MINKIVHITLALTVFLSSGGFWTNSHYCQNKLTNSSFLLIFGTCCANDTAPCSSEMEDMSCSHEEQEDDCCDNILSFHKLDQDQLLVKTDLKSFDHSLTVDFISSISHFELQKIDKSHLNYYTYIPPLIVFDFQVELQTFLC